MKPIYLEPDEEITSVIDKLKSAESRDVAVVVPKNSTLFQSLINLKLLQREAANLDKRVSLISTNKIGARLARQVGLETYANLGGLAGTAPTATPNPIPLAATTMIDGVKVNQYTGPQGSESGEVVQDAEPAQPVEELPKEEASPPAPEEGSELAPEPAETVPPKVGETISVDELPSIVSRQKTAPRYKVERTPIDFKLPWKSLIATVIILLISFTIIFVFLPKATVTLTLQAESKSKTLLLNAKTTADSSPSTIAGSLLTSEGSTTKKITATGKKDIGTKSSGRITFYNKASSSSVTLAALASVSSSGKIFSLNSAITIPGASVSGGSVVPGQASGSVTAAVSGNAYNLQSAQFTISGQGALVYATGSTSGGVTKTVTVLSQGDIDKVISSAKKELVAEAEKDLGKKGEGQTVLDGSVRQKVKEQDIDRSVGEQVDSATLKLTLSLSVIAFDKNAVLEKVRLELSKGITDNQQLVLPENTSPKLTFKKYDSSNSVMTFNVEAEGFVAPKIDKTAIAKQINNLTFDAAQAALKSQSEVTETTVDVTPSWWIRRLPILPSMITVEYGFVESTK
ncbi:hypothetical protein A3A71_03525 [Candidatus Berkelbacteria bacterium RIFCSPLOWO2_01_FULL_50_28]|uniref:Baseplate protein J-like domain-containing protein n=1 Tax=Candidatus Berkelbacteria bacterium RIFCSPLOWO2_01_FULL_50_28 TaxID=1797471 RepID=A0A1F5ECN1_9BACT|nr:MAG: hypothetical protein A2807_03090 [Candidatus Berkelbacteria bacterium RIFCSPHIGHO2_01_FULL_50_36]OGD63648.1 MAG: hypothetical protein A3F39_04305 [Candidatus Berkelbacteria bacterium RIFCSPHIGHO2_12_FULL_50_11]OGD65125.1 MAG: hypothetical protein A3A71_03525 [Candidatus Berkelbacteria bacterium RIFCSPLOWO2_01_FULL_50_28]